MKISKEARDLKEFILKHSIIKEKDLNKEEIWGLRAIKKMIIN